MAAPAAQQPFFEQTRRFRALLAALSAVPAEALPKLSLALTRVATQVVGGAAGARAFSDEEEAQLVALLGLADGAALVLVLEGAAFVYETAALHGLKSAALGQALLAAGLSEAAAVAVVGVWTANSAAMLARLRARAHGAPQQLLGSGWRVGLPLGRAGLGGAAAQAAHREAGATLELLLGPADAPPVRSLTLEFDRPALLGLLERLDAVQAQLDSLS